MVVDLFLVYQFIKRLATPFKEWDAYDLGIIDEKGNQLKKRKEFTKNAEHNAFGVFDILVLKLKRLLEKVPGGKTRLGSYAAALYLVKEHKNIEDVETLTEEEILSKLNEYKTLVESSNNINVLFEKIIDEEMPANNTGNVAGTSEPVVTHNAAKKYKKKNQEIGSFKRYINKV